MTGRRVGSALAVLLGVTLGVVGCDRIERGEPEAPQAPVSEPPAKPPAKKAKLAKRKKVRARSQHLTFQQLQALGYVDGTYDPNSDLADVVVNDLQEVLR